MADYGRAFVPGGTYFFTQVTFNRSPILVTELARTILRGAFRQVRTRLPFSVDGIVLLPDHFHCIWTLPRGDADYPTR
jgi:putative transposase